MTEITVHYHLCRWVQSLSHDVCPSASREPVWVRPHSCMYKSRIILRKSIHPVWTHVCSREISAQGYYYFHFSFFTAVELLINLPKHCTSRSSDIQATPTASKVKKLIGNPWINPLWQSQEIIAWLRHEKHNFQCSFLRSFISSLSRITFVKPTCK